MDSLAVIPVPCLEDNYAYLVVCTETREAAVVDPSQAEPVLAAVEANQVVLRAILNTHHHWDHVGGNEALCDRFGSLEVFGHAWDGGRIPRQTHFLEDGARVAVGHLEATVRHVPGHTLGAVAYCFPGSVFTGDTLFHGGCGRLFEGTPEMMYLSLTDRLTRHLAPETRVWCGHEYTVANLRFARATEPDNEAVHQRLTWAEARRAEGHPTIPSTIADELEVNPFVRAGSVEAFAVRRRAKDGFRG